METETEYDDVDEIDDDELVELEDVSAEELMSAASDALDVYLLAEFADEDQPVVGWVEDTFADHVAVGVGQYDTDGTPSVEFWDLPVEWFDDSEDGVFAMIDGDPTLLEVVGVAAGDDGKCLSAPEIIRSGLAHKSQMQARRRIEMLPAVVGDGEIKAISAQVRYDPDDGKADAYCATPSMADRVIRKRKRRGSKDVNAEFDAYSSALTKSALDVLTEAHLYAAGGGNVEALQEAHKSLGTILVSEGESDDAVVLDADMLAYALERGIDPFGGGEEPETACP